MDLCELCEEVLAVVPESGVVDWIGGRAGVVAACGDFGAVVCEEAVGEFWVS